MPTLTLEKIDKLYKAGKLEAAKKGYFALLKQNSRPAEALHGLALIAVEENQLIQAVDYLNQAIKHQPDNPTLQLHLANVFKMQREPEKARTILEHTVRQHPHYAAAFNNLGSLYYQQEKYLEAITLYQQALEKNPHYVDALYNLGLALIKSKKLEEAVGVLEKLLAVVADHAAARFQLACLFMQQEKWPEAIDQFLIITQAHPQHLESHSNLGTCYLQSALLPEAYRYYLQALALSPEDEQLLFNLAYISTQQGQLEEAITYYERLVKAHPQHFDGYNNLAAIYIYLQKTDLALKYLSTASELQPHNSYLSHLIHILKNDSNVSISPPAYLKTLFDYYASHYETHLLKVLDYRVPQVLLQILGKSGAHSRVKSRVLDLGCGTGLCGVVFKPLASELTGIDLSAQMLKKAAEKQLYDHLIERDFMHFLDEQKNAYDIIVAGDTLVYLGALDLMFTAIYQALQPGGLFIFNTEISVHKAFTLNPSGRFSHHHGYVEKSLLNSGLLLRVHDTALTRYQNQQAVYGHIYLVQKPTFLNSSDIINIHKS